MTRKELIAELLNTPAEVHAAVHGIYAGLTEWKGTELPDDPEILDEPHYYKGGYIVGTIVRWIAIMIAGVIGVSISV